MSTPINQQVAHILLEKQAVILQPDDPFTCLLYTSQSPRDS